MKIHMTQFPAISETVYQWIDTMQSSFVTVLIFLLFLFNFTTSIVPSESMNPTLTPREFLLGLKGNDFTYDDIVVFYPHEGDDET